MAYQKINNNDVLEIIAKCEFPLDSSDPCFISAKNIASLLKTSVYQARKICKQLVEQGLVSKHCEYIYLEDGGFTMHGYKISQKGKETDIYQHISNEMEKLFQMV